MEGKIEFLLSISDSPPFAKYRQLNLVLVLCNYLAFFLLLLVVRGIVENCRLTELISDLQITTQQVRLSVQCSGNHKTSALYTVYCALYTLYISSNSLFIIYTLEYTK